MEPTNPVNPYAAPKADINVSGANQLAAGNLATRWQRFGGSFVDGILTWVGLGPAYLGVSFTAVSKQPGTFKNPFFVYTASGSWGLLAAALTIGITALQWYLIVKRGQTVGKMAAGTRIAMLDGSRPGFVNALALRTWPVWAFSLLAGALPALGVATLIDVLLIFRADRRCLHDLIAGTKVVRVAKTP
jgi:uncharacterized RDD family membrane protein YckC